MATSSKYEIIRSTTKSDLAKALFGRKPLELEIEVFAETSIISVILTSVTAEDGNSELWTLKGHVLTGYIKENTEFEARLQTDRVKGWITVEEDKKI